MAKDKLPELREKEKANSTSPEIEPHKSLQMQINFEYTLAWKNQKSKKDKQLKRLRLYNNQKRDRKAVGDTTMFTIHQTVLASLYADRLMVEFGGRVEDDEEVAENLNAMAEYDYDEMEKDEIDYDWDWDSLFFGRGIISQEEYIRDPDNGIYLPVPHLRDPVTFLRDPDATSINGDRTGQGAALFFGYETSMTRKEIEENPHMLKETLKFEEFSIDSGIMSVLEDAVAARTEAQGRDDVTKFKNAYKQGANAQFAVTVWYTHDTDGKKVKVWLVNDRSRVIGYKKLKHDYWPYNDRPLYPTAHDWDGTSIPDLTEDKQRARAIAATLGLDAMKADLYPMYLYDSNKITNRNDLNFGFNKFIPVDTKGERIDNAILPFIKSRPNMNLLEFIYTTLDLSAQKATATPELQQGMMSKQQRTLGEINIVASRADTRYSLSAKIFGWSERRFWRQWYQVYKDNFKEDIDEKVLRLTGAFGAKWRPLQKKDIVATLDPHVKIESQILTRAKQLEERQSLTGYFGLALQEQTSNRRYGLKKLGRLHGLEKDELDRLFPPTIDEREAEQQNDSLSENKLVPVLAEDDHNVHLEIHGKAAETPATKAHIEAHKDALLLKKLKPELFPQEPTQTDFQPPGTKSILPPGNVGMPREQKPISPSQTSGGLQQ